jgi:hypothetical protein
MSILGEFGRGAWQEYTGFPIDVLSPVSGVELSRIQQRIAHWTNESYKILRSQLSSTGTERLPGAKSVLGETISHKTGLTSGEEGSIVGRPRRVFISYSQDNKPPEHCDRVHALANRLRIEGVDVAIDLYVPSPEEGWPQWMRRQIRESDFVLCVCSTAYLERFENDKASTKGRGARFEGSIITNEVYQQSCQDNKFVPVLFDGATEQDIPVVLQTRTYYRLPVQYDNLFAQLTGQTVHFKPPIGGIRKLNPRSPTIISTDSEVRDAPPSEPRRDPSNHLEARVTRHSDHGTAGLLITIFSRQTTNLKRCGILLNDARSFDSRNSAYREGFGLKTVALTTKDTLLAGGKTSDAWLVRVNGDRLEAGNVNGGGILQWPRGDATDPQVWLLTLTVESESANHWTFNVRISWSRQSSHLGSTLL